jgi:hypothetical protein
MENKTTPTPRQQISRLLIVLASGVICALLFALTMLYNYGPTGRYFVKNVLLSPEMIPSLSYVENNPNSGKLARFVFNRIAYTYWNPEKKEWNRVLVDQKHYGQFYEIVAEDKNIVDVSDELVTLFYREKPSRLIISVHTDIANPMLSDERPFQSVEVLPDSDYFRIELRGETNRAGWAYFHHQAISSQATQLLQPEEVRSKQPTPF